MNKIIEWKTLNPEDIEVRVATVKNGKATMLLYQDSRCTMKALDEQFGSFGWSIDYEVIGEQIYGKLSIYDDERGVWVSKMDTGDKSNISEDKGQSSDILKRCAVRWGFARELYTVPKIIMDDDGYGNSGYKVSHIEYDENRNIISLQIVNKWGKLAFNWEKGTDIPQTPKSVSNAPKMAINNNREKLTQFCSQKKAEGVDKEMLKRFYDTYITKVDNWEGKFMVDRLWKYWDKAA